MQILYCDDCGTRVDESEAVGDAGKTYCARCAPKHVSIQKTGGTTTLPPPTRSTRTLRPSRTTPVRPGPIGRTPPKGTGGVDNQNVASNDADTDTNTGDFSNALPNSNLRVTPLARVYQWSSRNKAWAIALGGAATGLLVFMLWTLTGSGDSGRPAPVLKAPIVATSPGSVTATTILPTTASSATTVPNSTTVAGRTDETDPREDKAKRDWKAIQETIASGNSNPYEIRKRLKALVEPFWIRKTALGQDATKLLDNYKDEKRGPDKSAGVVPGVTVAVSKNSDKADAVFNTEFKPEATKTVRDINFQNAASLKSAFGRETNLALKFSGFVDIPVDGKYTFYISSDDGSMLYIGDEMLIFNAGSHAMQEREGGIDLKPGKHKFRLEYYNGDGLAGMVFSWSGPGIAGKQVVPAKSLFSIPPQK